jgi:tRNA pseudouridine(38-40) synthase
MLETSGTDLPRNLKLTLAYDGHDFAGWQIQPDRLSVQGTLVSAFEHLTGEKTLPQGSGRTDAGVHALAQVATVTTNSPIPVDNLVRALNDILPRSIRVLAAEEMPPEFHARRSAVAKTYRYHIYRGAICSPFQARYVYHHPYPLDESRMVQAAALVEGEHDFTSFAAVDPEKRKDSLAIDKERSGTKPGVKTKAGFEKKAGIKEKAGVEMKAGLETNAWPQEKAGLQEKRGLQKRPGLETKAGIEMDNPALEIDKAGLEINNVRTIFHSQWQRHGDELIYTVRGNGFLHHMVRNLVGTFLMVGKGSLTVADVRRILELRDRSAAAATAPASGLFLVSVEYE